MVINGQFERGTLRIVEVAKVLGIGRSSAYALAAEGRLPGLLRLPGCRKLLISRRLLEKFLEGEEVGQGG